MESCEANIELAHQQSNAAKLNRGHKYLQIPVGGKLRHKTANIPDMDTCIQGVSICVWVIKDCEFGTTPPFPPHLVPLPWGEETQAQPFVITGFHGWNFRKSLV